MENTLYIVVPCYNEEEVLFETSSRLREKVRAMIKQGKVSEDSRIIFVNDGSKDKTWEIIYKLHKEDPIFGGINLSCNRGHQNALLAGLMTVKDLCSMAVSMDADLQDDIDAVEQMVDRYLDGCDIVYGVRSKRETDTFFKKATAEGFYKFMNLLGANTVYNHADYRLMSRRALNGLAEFKEVNLFLRGIVPMIGYKSDVVYYERHERFAGTSKYPLKKMISFAMEGITSLSIKPMRMITGVGMAVVGISILMLAYSVIQYFRGNTVPGWSSLMVSVWVVGGMILVSLGIVGEYVGKIYMETKGRPRYLIQEFLNEKGEKNEEE
ncbi:MAG: glycosyltransferase family 2 protein [Lachnoclostridium edouardi]|uniref:glycosyltransferase family 2 protein n=1 Tax=Lachnoclostridium edouardi TaxID=1926283 RepID=UPI0026DD3F7B|nr:glycosyltransferase family 2 protein [Lachnoclostridium edouardi]MDO4278886.1 glycosyltransferase family 2 protein [Lachnoclostridium edouardi]